MRKIIIVVIVVCLVVAVLLSSVFMNNNTGTANASASASLQSEVQGSMVVWNKERDQKMFETTDASAIGSVIALIKKATWTSVAAEPTGSAVKSAYDLTIYDQSGKGEPYSMLYMSDNTIILVYLTVNNDGTYLQASFPIQAGGLGDYIKFDPAASAAPATSAAASNAAPATSAAASTAAPSASAS